MYEQLVVSVKTFEEEMNDIISNDRTPVGQSIKRKKLDFPGDVSRARVHLANHIF